MVPLLGAIAGCHSRVLDQFWGSGRGHCWVPFAGCHLLDAMCSTPFGGVDVVPLLGAIAGCHSNVLWSWTWCHCWAIPIAICHCNVLWWEARVTTIFGRVDVVPLQGAIAGCHCRVPSIFRATNFTQTPKKTAMNFVLSFLQTLHCSLH